MKLKKNDFSFFKNLFDLFPEPILIIKKSLEIIYANFEAQDFLKKSWNQIKFKKITEIFQCNYTETILPEISKKSGVFFARQGMHFNNSNLDVQFIVTENDLIMLNIKREKVPLIDFYKENFDIFDNVFSIINHEISNPLSSIKMASQLMIKSKEIDKELMGIVLNESNRISKILASFTFDLNDQDLKKKKSENIHEVLRYSLFKLKNKLKKIKVSENFDPSLPKIDIDKNLIIQVFDNLLNNAYEASKFSSNSYIKISTKFNYGETIKIPNIKKRDRRNSIIISIEDNGNGIDPNDINKIFLPFYSTKKKGSGIGLYLVKRIIDFHNGEISVECNDLNTIFFLKLPL